MSNTKINLITFINFLFLVNFSSSLKIHILRNPIEPPKRPGEIDIKKLPDSKLTKICKTVLNTADNLGNNPFQIYNLCEKKYELFGSKDEIIMKDKPFCYDNIQKFFCNIKIIDDLNPELPDEPIDKEDLDIKITDNSEPCSYKNLTGLVLSAIQGCIKDDKNLYEKAMNNLEFSDPIKNITKSNVEGNKCPSLNYDNYKIQNKTDFCLKAQKKEIIPLQKGGHDIEYLIIKENEQIKCNKIIELYNLCIDTDYILYPNSDYGRCFNKLNSIYSCNLIKPFLSNYDKDMCSNYVLPMIVRDFSKGKIKDIKDYCFDFNDKLTETYVAEIEANKNLINANVNKIKNFNDFNIKTANLNFKIMNTLNDTGIVSKSWMDFYPKFTHRYELHSNITNSEFKELKKLREKFDKSFQYIAEIDRVLKSPFIQKANLNVNIDSFEDKIKNIDIHFNTLNTIIKEYNRVLTSNNFNKNTTFPNFDNEFVSDDNLSVNEILEFQNQFVEMIQYAKNYMNFIVKKIKEGKIINNKLMLNSQLEIKRISDRISKIEQKKTDLIKDILKE